MWTPTTRQQHSRIVTRYQTDLTDAEWRVIVPHTPRTASPTAGSPPASPPRPRPKEDWAKPKGVSQTD